MRSAISPKKLPQYRGNKQLTERPLLRGRITQPEILWRHFTGARQTFLTVKLQSKDTVQPLPSIDYDVTRRVLMVAVAYHEINEGGVLWKEIFPADIGAPAIAEMNGKTPIVVVCQDGYIYGLGQADNRPVLKSDVATVIRGMEP